LETGFQRSPFSARFTESATLAIARYSALMPMARMTSPIWRIRHARWRQRPRALGAGIDAEEATRPGT
jgi:hypothetical protein